MRVAVVVRSLKIGGMERAAINLAETFEANGHEAHLIYFRNKNKALAPSDRIHLHHFDIDRIMKWSVIGIFWNFFSRLMNGVIRGSFFFWKGLFASPIFMFKLRSLEKEYGHFDLVIFRGQGTFEILWPLKDPRFILQQVNVIFKHGNVLHNFYLRCLYQDKNLMSISYAVNDDNQKIFENAKVYPRRIDIITNPVNVLQIQERSLEYAPSISEPYIVNVSRFARIKNHDLLLESYKYAREFLELKHKLVLVGGGYHRNAIEQKINALQLTEHVILTGSLTNPYPWVKNADLFVFTSFAEGLGNVLLEALACNTNIVATKGRGGVLDIMRGEMAAHLCNFDKVEIAHKIMSELTRTTPVDFQKALEPFTPKGIIDQYITSYTA